MNLDLENTSLENGLKVISCRRTGAPVVAVQVWYRVGSVNEHDGIRGGTHVLEHMMFRGSERFGPQEHAQRINDVGGHSNAFTAEDVTAYLNSVPSTQLEMVMAMEADRMANLTLDSSVFETERAVIIEEYHTYMNNPVTKAFLEFRSAFFEDHPYSISPLGRLEDLQNMSVKMLRSYYHKWYAPENAVLVVVGDFESHTAVYEAAESYFGALGNKEYKSDNHGNFSLPAQTPGRWMKRKVDFDVPMLIAGFKAPPANHTAGLALDIMQMIAAQGETSRMHRQLVRRSSLAVIAGGMNHFLRMAGMSLFFAAFTPEVSVKKLDRAMTRVINDLREKGPEPKEIEKVRNAMLTGRSFELYSAENICQRLGYAEVVEGDYRLWVKRLEELQKISNEQLLSAAGTYWDDKQRFTLYLRPRRIKPMIYMAGILRRIFPRS